LTFEEPRDYFYPIPAEEILLNPALTQNPGW
nr:RagB/SusD family nutrient uptake outer membrane protein [Bacteroidales bacterium]